MLTYLTHICKQVILFNFYNRSTKTLTGVLIMITTKTKFIDKLKMVGLIASNTDTSDKNKTPYERVKLDPTKFPKIIKMIEIISAMGPETPNKKKAAHIENHCAIADFSKYLTNVEKCLSKISDDELETICAGMPDEKDQIMKKYFSSDEEVSYISKISALILLSNFLDIFNNK